MSDRHIFGRLSYLLTARIEGIDPTPSRFGLPLATHITTPVIGDDIRFKQDFERVIEHSNKAERALGRFRTGDGKRPGGLPTEAQRRASELSMARTCEADPRLDGLFQQQVIRNDGSSDARETPKWLKGDIVISQNISIQSSGLQNESRTSLDMTNQAYEEGLGVYQVSMSSDCVSECPESLGMRLMFPVCGWWRSDSPTQLPLALPSDRHHVDRGLYRAAILCLLASSSQGSASDR